MALPVVVWMPSAVELIPNDVVSLVIVMEPSLVNRMPSTPAAGAIACVRLLTFSVVTGGAKKSVPLAMPAD